MKQLKVFYVIAAIILLSGMMYSCTKNEDGSFGEANNLKTGQIEMKVTPNSANKVSFSATAMRVTIDWGDGNIDEITPNGDSRSYLHEYSNQKTQTIIVTTEGMTGFSCSSTLRMITRELRFGYCPELKSIMCNHNQLTVLDTNQCLELTSLFCDANQLTTLDISQCTKLSTLWCTGNKL